MAGFGENCGLHRLFKESVRKTLFSSSTIGTISPSIDGWTNEILDWGNPENQNIKRKLNPSKWNFLQGDKKVSGHLIGGCMETMEQIKGTIIWPSSDYFKNAILFFETCDENIMQNRLEYMLRNYCATGIIQNCSGIIFGRPAAINHDDFSKYDEIIKTILNEYGLTDLPVITQMDFGHTDPMFIIPYGAMAEIDPVNKTFSILENGVK
jgi:muramoyltetrapeptide carboxypeptidase LdcA involved in peptidoglycan recycling